MKAVIFDMDGTMVDNMMVHHRAWQKTLESLGMSLSIEEVMQKVHGINEEILERLFGDKLTAEERKQKSIEKEEAYRRIFKDDLSLIPGLRAFLDVLKAKKIPMAVASAAPPENVDFVLDNLDIRSYFSAVLHSEDVTKGKPDPEIYLKTADRLGLNPNECLVFEDSVVGARAAERAGCPLIIVTTTHQLIEFKDIKGVFQFINDYHTISFTELATY